MAQIKKNALGQVLFIEVDSTDFATVKSALTVAPTAKYFGVNHGGSAATTSGAISKVISHVHSGIYRATFKAAETNFDYVLYSIKQASCADQTLVFQPVDNDDSDLMSTLTIIQSMASDAASAAQQANSRVLLNQSRISDAYSMLSDFYSDFQSRVPKAVATNSQLSDLHSDLRSYLVVMSGVQSDVYSLLSDFQSDFQSRVPKAVATNSQLSDLQSDLKSYLIVMSGVQSDIYSLLSDFQSDFQSRVPKRVATDSQLSDLSSDLRSYLVGMSGMLSDTYSLLSDAYSDTQSRLSRIQEVAILRRATAQAGAATTITLDASASATDNFYTGATINLVSGTGSGQAARTIISYVGSTKVATISPSWTTNPDGTTVFVIRGELGLTDSFLSDIASQVWAHATGTRVDSRILLNQSRISDTYSMLSDFYSDFQSRVPKAVATNSQLSDLHSDLRSYLVVMSGVQSDLYSLLSDFQSDFQSRVPKTVATNSQLSDLHSDLRSFLVVMSGVLSDTYSLLSDTNSDLASKIGGITASVSASDISDIASAVWANTIGARVDSRVLLNLSRISDVYSLLSDTNSDLRSLITTTGVTLDTSAFSDIRSAIAAGPAATVTASDISDIASAVWAFTTRKLTSNIGLNASDMSDIRSAIAAGPAATVTASDISDIASAVWANTIGARVDSRVLLNQSRISDTYSMLSDFYSDFQSRVPKAVATNSQLSDLHSDLRSYLVVMSGVQSDIYSLLSDHHSDLRSLITTTGVPLDASTMSDIRSAITAGGTATVSASDISDIASAVWANTIGARVDSRVLLNLSRISDVYSLLSDTNSDLRSLLVTTGIALDASTMSDLRSAITASPTVSTSDISDIASAVWANTIGARVDSRVLLNLSRISDTYSMLSDFYSDFQSRVPKAVATNSQLSDLQSDLRSYLVVMSGVQSDIYSLLSDFQSDFQSRVPKAVATNSQLSDLTSDLRSYMTGLSATLSDTYSLLSDTQSNLSARLPTTLSSGRMRVDVEAVAANVTAATNLRQTLIGAVTGSAVSGTLSTTQMSTDLTETTNDHYNGRILTFLTGTLVGQQTDIVSYNGSTKVITYTACTEAALAGDSFVIT